MMLFQVKWGDIQAEFAKRINKVEPGEKITLRFYFETQSEILTFLTIGGATLYSKVPKQDLDVKGFKISYLFDAYELQTNPLTRY